MLINRQKNTSCLRGVALRGFASLSDVLTTTAAAMASTAQTRWSVLRHSPAVAGASHVSFRVQSETTDMETAIQLLVCNEFECSPPPRRHLSAVKIVLGDSQGSFK